MSKLIFQVLLLVVCSGFILAADYEPEDELDCPQICPDLYAPVCATDGRMYKEFSNPCELQASNCRLRRSAVKQAFLKTDMAWCTSTLVSNLREKLGKLNWLKPTCMKPCAMIYEPICASNGNLRATLSNKCEMDFYNCILGPHNTSKLFRVLKQGEC